MMLVILCIFPKIVIIQAHVNVRTFEFQNLMSNVNSLFTNLQEF